MPVIYSSVRVIASRILHKICLLVGELAIRGTKLTLNARLGIKSNLLIEQLLLGEHYCMRSYYGQRLVLRLHRDKTSITNYQVFFVIRVK